MMSISKIVYGVIAIVVVVIVVATVLIPTVSGLEFTGSNATMYTTLLGVVCTLGILIPVMLSVKMIAGGKD